MKKKAKFFSVKLVELFSIHFTITYWKCHWRVCWHSTRSEWPLYTITMLTIWKWGQQRNYTLYNTLVQNGAQHHSFTHNVHFVEIKGLSNCNNLQLYESCYFCINWSISLSKKQERTTSTSCPLTYIQFPKLNYTWYW